jgi:hypothetical protein
VLIDPSEVAAFLFARRSRPRAQLKPDAGLRVTNDLNTGAMVIVNGLAMGWVGSGGELLFKGFPAGRYRIGAIRPLGRLCHGPRMMTLPGALTLGTVGKQAAEQPQP